MHKPVMSLAAVFVALMALSLPAEATELLREGFDDGQITDGNPVTWIRDPHTPQSPDPELVCAEADPQNSSICLNYFARGHLSTDPGKSGNTVVYFTDNPIEAKSWQFDSRIPSDKTTTVNFLIIADAKSGAPTTSYYMLFHDGDKDVAGTSFVSLRRRTGEMGSTPVEWEELIRVGGFPLDEWLTIGMTKSENFDFQVFVDGVVYGSTTDSDVEKQIASTPYFGIGRYRDYDNIVVTDEIIDQRPIAQAGPDQTVDEGMSVFLDGSGSTDPQGDPLTYTWEQVAGEEVTLDLTDPVHPIFTVPYINGNDTLTVTLQLVVSDGKGSPSDPDAVDITVVNVNNPPVADAGDDSTIKEGATGSLDASNSYDPEGDAPLFYYWSPAALLNDPNAVSPNFTAPLGVGTPLAFELVVSDGREESTPDHVSVTVVENSKPVADAGPDQTRDEGSIVSLDGRASSDPDGGDTLSYQWIQTAGPLVTLSDATSALASFDAPAVSLGGQVLEFELVVTDDDAANPKSSDADVVEVTVLNSNDPPSCATARPSTEGLWPPNHKMKQVEIEGVSDPDATYNVVTIDITGVTQDEPVGGLGSGDSSPDAVIQLGDPRDTVLIRTERSGTGNGRVYGVSFTAADGFESCTGSVRVSVPQSRTSTAIDDGQVYDSTQP